MQTINPHILNDLVKQIEPYAVTDTFVIDEWLSRTGIHESPNNIVLDENPPQTMHLGDRWKVGYDETRYFEADVIVPDYLAGKKVYLSIDFGGEALVRINGEIVGAVSSRENSGWVHRTEILFKDKFKGGEKLSIQVEGAVDCASFCNRAIAGEKQLEYTLKKAELVAVNEKAESYWYDISTAHEVYECCEDEYIKSRLYIAIDDSAHEINYDMGEEAFLESVDKAAETLWNKISEINYSTPGEVFMGGHSHLDVAWLWTVKEITRKTARTFSNNLALMDNYPDFKFTQSQAVLYDFMKKYYPDIFERVKEKVKNGQWEIVGNAWVEADTNIASGESLIRQLLYGREFFLKEFGISSDVYWLPDCFGFTWALPQIIKRSGMKYFLTSKLQYNDTNEFPMSVFKWRSHSGDEVLAYMQKVHYQGEYNPSYIKYCRKNNRQNNIVDCSFGMFGYGDGGGGCTYQMLEKGERCRKLPGLPKSKNTHVSEFFKEAEKKIDELPVWDGEMYFENHRGTFTSQAFVKKNNRRGEFMLRDAELLSVLSGIEYPREKLDETWKLLLINQFHDILPGTSIHEVFDDCKKDYARMHTLGGEIVDSAMARLSAEISPEKDSITVWNTLSFAVSGTVKAETPYKAGGIKNKNGEPLPCLTEEENGKYYIEFYADFVPALGYALFELTDDKADFDCVKAEKNLLENKYLKIELDENGLLTSVYDKESERQILTGKGNLLTVSHDKAVHETAWNLEFNYQKKQWELTKAEKIEVVEASPLRAVIRVIRRFNDSVFTQDITLERNSRTLDFRTTVDWHEKQKVLKAAFPVDVRNRNVSCEIAHGSAEYPTHYNTSYDLAKFEFCAHKWADLSDGGYGVSLLNDCKYGYNVHDNIMKITLMRAPNMPDATADMGISEFCYSLYPHTGTWREADTVKLGFIENEPPKAVFQKAAGGSDKEKSFGCVSADNVILDALKAAQDGDGYIVRLYEAETKHTKVSVSLDIPYSRVTECNLMEQNEKEIPCENREFTFEIKPHEVKTFRLR